MKRTPLSRSRKPPTRAVKARRAAKRARKTALMIADLAARDVVFERDGFTCVGPPVLGAPHCCKQTGLCWAHVITRRLKATRHMPENALTLCFGCHLKWHHSPMESGAWFRETYPERYGLLMEARKK